MPLRFHRSVALAKFLRLNVSKRGASVSLGGHGATLNIASDGSERATVGLPGTGLSWYQTRRRQRRPRAATLWWPLRIVRLLRWLLLLAVVYLIIEGVRP